MDFPLLSKIPELVDETDTSMKINDSEDCMIMTPEIIVIDEINTTVV
jgi:hypothetical protein